MRFVLIVGRPADVVDFASENRVFSHPFHYFMAIDIFQRQEPPVSDNVALVNASPHTIAETAVDKQSVDTDRRIVQISDCALEALAQNGTV